MQLSAGWQQMIEALVRKAAPDLIAQVEAIREPIAQSRNLIAESRDMLALLSQEEATRHAEWQEAVGRAHAKSETIEAARNDAIKQMTDLLVKQQTGRDTLQEQQFTYLADRADKIDQRLDALRECVQTLGKILIDRLPSKIGNEDVTDKAMSEFFGQKFSPRHSDANSGG
jgi:DNA repair exonuclease SbcCD ATPase subunit